MTVRLDLQPQFAVVTLAWPNAACLLDASAAQGLATALQSAQGAGSRAVVLAAEGPAFCLGEVDEPADVNGRPPSTVAVGALAAMRMPVICALEGPALDAGLELALACDLRVASTAASFRMGHLGIADFPHAGGTQRLPRTVGRAAALELLLLGDTWDAERAHAAGFAAPVTPAGGALAAAVALAQRLAGMAPVAAEYLKEAVLQGTERPMEAALQLEADLYFLLQTTDDRAEGIRAFHEKRTPQFEGR